MIRNLKKDDYEEVKAIYLQGIATGNATFETKAKEWNVWDSSYLSHSRLVVEEQGLVIGWAALSPISTRAVYAGVAEVSVYIRDGYQGRKIGGFLLEQLVKESEKNGIWTLLSSIFPENQSSIRIHENNGFRTIGVRHKIAQLNGVWRDTLLMERRSTIVGQ